MKRSAWRSVCLVLLLIGSARAYAAPKRVGIPKFEGKQEALVRKAVMKGLKVHGYELVKSREMEAAISSSGAQLDSDDGLKKLAKELALAAIITGEVGPRRAKIVVHDGSEGSVLGDGSFAGANPRKIAAEVGRDFWRKLGADIGRGQVPTGAKKGHKAAVAEAAEDNEDSEEGGGDEETGETKDKDKDKAEAAEPSEEAAPAAEDSSKNRKKAKTKAKPKMETEGETDKGTETETEKKPEETESAPSTPSPLPWADVGVAVGAVNRNLSFNENRSTVGPYALGIGPVAEVSAVVYPGAAFMDGVAGNIGVEGEIEQGFGISSAVSGGGKYGNVVHDFAGGARFRLPFSGTNEFDVSATGGEHAFTFTTTGTASRAALAIPDTIYQYVRGGVGLRVALPVGISVSLSGGYRYILNKGGTQLKDFFPHLAVSGADAEIGGGYPLTQHLEVRAGVSWRRYWYAMNSVKGDTFIVGGAVDQYFAFTAGVAYTFGGSGASAAEPSAEPGAEAPPLPAPKAKAKKHSADSDDESADDGDKGDKGADKGGDKGDDDDK